MTRSRPVAVSVLAASVVAAAHAHTVERAVAVTFDDLPAVAAAANDLASLRQLTQRLLESVRKHGIPAAGFVNEGKLLAAGPSEVEGRTALLRMWLDAGLELGNHSYSHRDLNRVPLDEFEADVIRGELVTRRLLAEKGRQPRYFRHPLVRRGYRFVSLAEALEDDVYRLPDTFVGAPGNSWLNHWEVTAGRKPVPTPSPPDWFMKAYAALPR